MMSGENINEHNPWAERFAIDQKALNDGWPQPCAPVVNSDGKTADAVQTVKDMVAAETYTFDDAEYRQAKRRWDALQRLKREQIERRITGELSPTAEAYRDRLLAALKKSHQLDEIADPEPLIDGWIHLDSLTWMAGPSGAYKSFVAFDLAARFASDSIDYHGEPMAHGKALYIIAGGASMFKHRKRAWEFENNERVDVVFLPEAVQLNDLESAMPALIALAREEGYKLIVFDTQAMCTVGAEESDNTDMGIVINALHSLRAATGACVLLVHHFGKDSASGMRGASAIYAAANTVITVKLPQSEPNGN